MSGSLEDVEALWSKASGFLMNGRICGDWSLPSPDEMAEAADDEAHSTDDVYASFYVYGERCLTREYYVDRAMIESGVLRGDCLTVDYSSDYVLEIVPLFKREEKAETGKRYKMVCDECGSENVLCDAYAQWDVRTQDWEVANTFDKGAFCPDCDGDARIEAVELDGDEEAAAQAA